VLTDAVTTGPATAIPTTGAGATPPTSGDSTALVSGELAYPPEMRRGISVVWVFLLIVLIVTLLVIFVVGCVRHWVALHTGILNGGPDKYYNFWSGFGSDLGEATLISAVGVGLYTGLRKVNCHTKGCWRIGKHQLDRTPFVLCRHHHPGVPSEGASYEHILAQHRRHQNCQAAKGL
jgi:hypothetical protein